jgi:DNA polymerase III sliding clamp (beta) subunit (PCNA family)
MSEYVVKKDELLLALKSAQPGLSAKETLEQATCFVFKDGYVITYNDYLSIRAPVSELDGLTGAINGLELLSFIEKAPQDELVFTKKEGEIQIKSGRARVGLRLLEEVKLPIEELFYEKEWENLPDDFLDGIEIALYSCSKDSSRPALTCIHIKDGTMESLDNIRLTRYSMESLMGGVDVLLPAVAAEKILKYALSQFHVAAEGSWMHFLTKENIEISCRLIKGKIPDISPLMIGTGLDFTFPKKVTEMLDRALVFCQREHMLDQEVEVMLSTKKITVKAKSSEGWFEEEAAVRYEGDAFSFIIHPIFLKEAIQRQTLCTVLSNRIRFQSNNWDHVIAMKV